MKIFKVVVIQFFYFITGVIAGALLLYWVMEYQHNELHLVVVPEVVGLNFDEASLVLKKAGVNPEIIGSGKVIGTYPRSGVNVFEGRKVEVYCFNFNVRRYINRLIGVNKDFAEEVLRDLDLKYSFSYIAYSKDEGRILSIYTKGNNVYLLVDKGERKKYFMITDFRGMEIEKAIEQAKSLDIPYQIIGNGKIVVDQSPAPGTVFDRIVLITR
ncbi:MAG: PASTA domain-containing protein [Thermotogaceae bacterium]|nr:PASTA domain-containing protein [Thermotogaceae bacterium]